MKRPGLAACRLLAEAHGIDTREETWTVLPGQHVRCDVASECRHCGYFDEFVEDIVHDVGGSVLWACFVCLGAPSEPNPLGILLGYYTSGLCDICREDRILLNAVLTKSRPRTSTRRPHGNGSRGEE